MRQRWSDERAGSRKVHIHQGPELSIRRVCEEGCGAYPRRSAPRRSAPRRSAPRRSAPCPPGLREPRGSLTAVQKSAEGIVGRRAGRRPERSPKGGEGKGNSLGRLMTASRSPSQLELDLPLRVPYLRGWAGYFGFSQWRELASLDGWIRRRLRCVVWGPWETFHCRPSSKKTVTVITDDGRQ